MNIGFFGPKGSFTHEVTLRHFSYTGVSLVEKPTIEALFDSLYRDELKKIVVPIENSVEGAVNATMDLLSQVEGIYIEEEMVSKINQNLLIREDSDKTQIKHIYSHPQALGQCRKYLSENFPKAEQLAAFSTSAAAKLVLEHEESAAIGSEEAAKIFDLKILQKGIQDSSSNATRFVVVSKECAKKSGSDKTSIVFSTEDKPGSLYRILDIFSLWDINLARIESRPSKDLLGRYIFFVDLEGHKDDADIKDALTMVKRKTSFYKFLGSYKKA